MPERDKIDQLIDSALASYAEPRAGLEQRMLARMAMDASRSSRRGWLLVAIAAPILAALILMIYLVPRAPHAQPPSQTASTSRGPSTTPSKEHPVGRVVTEPAPQVVQSSGSSHRIRHREQDVDEHTYNAALRPKENIFPRPQPMTAEEQALTRFAAEASEADRKALIEAQRRVDEPLNISAISIAPLPSLEDKQN
jgi:hypothetical protein